MSEKLQNLVLIPVDLDELLEKVKSIVEDALERRNRSEQEDKLLTPDLARKVFQPAISKFTLASWRDQGLIESHRIGQKVFYKLSDLLKANQTLKKYKRVVPINT
jgi:hypothetical protein